ENLATAELFQAFVAIHREKHEISPETLMNHVGDDEMMLDVAQQLLSGSPRRERDEPIDGVLREAENCVFTLRNMAIANRVAEISREAAFAESSGDSKLAGELAYEQLELEKIRRELRRRITEL